MNYALNLAEDKRILSATFPEYAPEDAVIVDSLPEGDIAEYRYVNGEYIHEPCDVIRHPMSSRNILEGEYITLDGVLYKATMNIPNGEPIIIGQNAVVTTIEQQLYELKGE